MKTLHFRCIKITQEEKRTNSYGDPEPVLEAHVDVQFLCVEAEVEMNKRSSTKLLMHGYLGLMLTREQFQELGYEVGKVYDLCPM